MLVMQSVMVQLLQKPVTVMDDHSVQPPVWWKTMVSVLALGTLSSSDLSDVMKKCVWWQKHHFCIRMHINELFSQMTTHII
jgi:hypothetical protein